MEQDKQQTKGRWKLLAVLAVCAAPILASYFTYYVVKPESRTNYGTLLDPRNYPMPALGAATVDGRASVLNEYRGKWIMLLTADADCRGACRKMLFEMRQLRIAQGKAMDRIERVWLITDQQPIETLLMREFDGTRMLRARPDVVNAWLPAEAGATVADHIYMIDPLGNLMMRFPKNADPNLIKKDLAKLLKASSIG